MELWDIYDEDRVNTGKTVLRGEQIPEGGYHIIVHVAVFNSKGQLLIQRRQLSKVGWPGLWDLSAGGCALAGENSRQAVCREFQEELGICPNPAELKRVLTVNFDGGMDDIYVVKKDIDLQELKLQPEEVMDVMWAEQEEVEKLLEREQFVPYHKNYLRFVFDLALRRSHL